MSGYACETCGAYLGPDFDSDESGDVCPECGDFSEFHWVASHPEDDSAWGDDDEDSDGEEE